MIGGPACDDRPAHLAGPVDPVSAGARAEAPSPNRRRRCWPAASVVDGRRPMGACPRCWRPEKGIVPARSDRATQPCHVYGHWPRRRQVRGGPAAVGRQGRRDVVESRACVAFLCASPSKVPHPSTTSWCTSSGTRRCHARGAKNRYYRVMSADPCPSIAGCQPASNR